MGLDVSNFAAPSQLTPSAWGDLVLPAHVTVHTGGYGAKAALIGPSLAVIQAYLTLDATGVSAGQPLFTLPSAAMFPATPMVLGMGDSNSNRQPAFISTAGVVTGTNSMSSVNLIISALVPLSF